MGFDRFTNRTENFAQCFRLAQRHLATQGVVQVDTGKIERGLLYIRPFKGLNVVGIGGIRKQVALRIHGQRDGGYLEYSVALGIKSPGF